MEKQKGMKLGIRNKLLLCLLALVLSPLIIDGSVSYIITRNQLEESKKAHLSDLARDCGRKISYYVSSHYQGIRLLSQAVVFKGRDTDAKQRYIENSIEAYPFYEAICVIDQEGTITACTRRESIGQSRADRVWFQRAIRGKQGDVITFDACREKTAGKIVIEFNTPITDEGSSEVIGVLAARISMDHIVERVQVLDKRTSNNNHAYLLNNRGEILAGPDEKEFLSTYRLHEFQVVKDLLAGKTGITEYENDRGEYIICAHYALRREGDFNGWGWGIIVNQSLSEAFKAAYSIRNKLVILTIVIAFLVTIFALFISKSFSKPITEVSESAMRISKGDLKPVRIEFGPKDEIGDLVCAFNRMTEDLNTTTVSRDSLAKEIAERIKAEKTLKKAGDELELRVKERTADLIAVNEKLQREITEHKQTEESLRKSETKFRELFNNMSSGVAVYEAIEDGEAFIIKEMNNAGEKINKVTRDSIIGRNIMDVAPGIKELGLLEVLKKVWRTGKAVSLPKSFYKDDLVSLWVDNYVYKLPSGEVVAVFDDITEKEKFESALQESEERLRLFMDSATEGFLLLDSELNIVEANKFALHRLLTRPDINNENIIGSNLLDFFPSFKETGKYARYLEIIRRAKSFLSLEFLNDSILKDQHFIIKSFKAGEGLGMIVEDITERKQMEEEINEHNKLLEIILESITHPFYVIDINSYKIKMANSAAKSLGNLQKNDTCYTLAHHRSEPCRIGQNKCPCPIEEVKRRKKPTIVSHIHYDTTGKAKYFEVHAYPILDREGNVVQMIEYSIDITERRRAEKQARMREQQLIQADKMVSLGVLVAGVAHEINNPNQLIMSNIPLLKGAWNSALQILEKYYEANGDFIFGGLNYSEMREEIPSCISEIEDGTGRINQIVVDLKRFARQDSQEAKLPIDINAVVKSSITLVSNLIEKSTSNFSVSLAENLPKIKGNFQQLEQVLINLLQNSCQALTNRKQGILVKTYYNKEKYCLEVTVQDEGMGIAQENLYKLKDPFFTTKRESGGTGLGLSVSSTIIREHNGILDFESEPGKGTTAIISLPMAENSLTEERQE